MKLQENIALTHANYHIGVGDCSQLNSTRSHIIQSKKPIRSRTINNRSCLNMNRLTPFKWITGLTCLLFLIFGTNSAIAASKLIAESSKSHQITTGKFLLAPVSVPTGANPQSSLTLLMTAKNDYFYLKNFGNYSIRYFTMTQTLAATTIRYCVNQNFRGGSYTRCADNSNAITVGNTLTLGRIQFSTPLGVGGSYHFSAVSNNSGNNAISVSISQNDLLTPNGTIYNS